MRSLLAIPLALILLFQVGSDAVMIQWQQHARESFANMFCVNKGLEEIPMCFGSCQLPELFVELTDDSGKHELGSVSAPTAVVAYLPVTPWVFPARPPAPATGHPERVFVLRQHVGSDVQVPVFQPPTA